MSDDFQGAPPAPEAPQAPPMAAPMGDASGPASDNSKMLAAIGYVIWPVALIAILIEPYKNEKWVKSHAVQALALNLVIYVLSAVTTPIFGLGILVGIGGFVYSILLAVKAWNGESIEVPMIYGFVKSYI
ncbi:MAG: DUF4870 domain-containing protein [Actinomycetota bacterium]|nr:MAG: hypothetical protein FD171_350 [Actinomycetota bacterium]MDO8950275.1 DUF4870 domain-containing protein [Actinomycetota bacterium]MDP3629798.1 DUF4870 domain-containing protein [Actinomycetota bacterium]